MPKLPEDPNVSAKAIALSQQMIALEAGIIVKRERELAAYKKIRSSLEPLTSDFIKQSIEQISQPKWVNDNIQGGAMLAERVIFATSNYLTLLLKYPQYILDLHNNGEKVEQNHSIIANYENLLANILNFFTQYQNSPELTLGLLSQNADLSERFDILVKFLTATLKKLTPLQKCISEIGDSSNKLLISGGKSIIENLDYRGITSLQQVAVDSSHIVATLLVALNESNQNLSQIDIKSLKKYAPSEANAAPQQQQQQIIQAKTHSGKQPTSIQYIQKLEDATREIAKLEDIVRSKGLFERELKKRTLHWKERAEKEIKKQEESQKILAEKDLTITSLKAELTTLQRELEATKKQLKNQQEQAADLSQQQTKATQSKASPTIFKTAAPAVPAAMGEKPKPP